jgi:PadR family transcriptional regulator PadR
MERDLSLGEFEKLTLLAVIHLRESAYGMRVRREIEERTGRDVSIGAVYTTLERLAAKGLVSSSLSDDSDPARSGRAKRFWSIEQPGIRALSESQRALCAMLRGLPQLEAL